LWPQAPQNFAPGSAFAPHSVQNRLADIAAGGSDAGALAAAGDSATFAVPLAVSFASVSFSSRARAASSSFSSCSRKRSFSRMSR